MRGTTLSGIALVALCAVAQGQDGEAGRAACLRFLTQGEYAPRPELKTLDGLEAHPGSGHPAQGELVELCGNGFTVAYDAQQAIVSYNAFDRAFRLPDSSLFNEPERALAEIRKRTRFSDAELARRAKAFFLSRIPDRERRLFKRTDSALLSNFNPIWYEVSYVEIPTDGALAVYPNTITVGLNPETGEVVFYRATHVRARWTEATPVDADAAYAAARALAPELTWKEPQRRLAFVEGEVRPRWVVAGDDGKQIVVADVDAVGGGAKVVAVFPLE
ncbi:MAG: hypothetical protein R3F62_19040 [Planctomycetota bacterium]